MSEYDRKRALQDFNDNKVRDVQNEHWKTQQDYNGALEAARKAAANKQ